MCLLLRCKLAEICVDDVHRRTVTESALVANVTKVMLALGDESFVEATGRRAGLDRRDKKVSEYRRNLHINVRTAVPVIRGLEPSPPLALSLAAGAEEPAAGAEEPAAGAEEPAGPEGAALLTGSASEDMPPETLTGTESAGEDETGKDPAGVEEGSSAMVL